MDDKILDHFLKELKLVDGKFLSIEEYCALHPGFHKDNKIWIDVPVIPEVKKPEKGGRK